MQFLSVSLIPGHGRSRASLGTRERAEAERLGRELVSALLRDGELLENGSLSIGLLWERYQRECPAFLDNTETTRSNDANHAAVLLAHFGADCDV